MPSNRRRTTRQPQPETPVQDESVIPQAHTLEAGQEQQGGGETPAPTTEEQTAAEAAVEGQEEQTAAETAVEHQEEQGSGDSHAPAAEEQAAAQTVDAQAGLPMTVQVHTGTPVEDVVATADVALGGICTIRNVKIKEDDYGLKVVMPRTKMPDTGRFKDACYFHTPELRAQFDAAVKEAYQQTLEPTQEQGGMGSMAM